MKYFPTIGLEVHAELHTKSKMFCGCKNEPHGSEPNTHVCPVCFAHPGTLPVPNQEAIKMVLQFGQAVGAVKADFSEFDRKNYFYPDIPKAYQISQYAFPLLTGGELAGVQLTRVHLEEDTARSQHDQGDESLVDFNRAGVPLMELVTEPVLHDATTAGDFARELQLLLRTLGISGAHMEKGEMRVEANISVSTDPATIAKTYVEVKNINSFKAVEAAIDFEIKRQSRMIDTGEPLRQETRGWDENKNQTFSQRSKETAKDYRYFPDPDLTKLKLSEISDFSEKALTEKMPILPKEKRELYSSYKISDQIIETIVADSRLDTLFGQTATLLAQQNKSAAILLAANYVSVDIATLMSEPQVDSAPINPPQLAQLMILAESGIVGSRGVKDLLPSLFGYTGDVHQLATEAGVVQQSDPAAMVTLAQQIIDQNPAQVAELKAGKLPLLKYLVGQGMKISKGAANPAVLEQVIQDEITK